MPAASKPRPWALPALLALVLLAFAPALRNGFIWDDDHYVTRNAELRSLQGLASTWLTPGSSEHVYGQYYPLVHTSFWLEWHLWADAPLGYHVDNVLLHALAALLLWRLLRRLELPGAWLAAALFAVHPVQVESVAWITERKNVLSGALAFAAALAFLSWAGIDPARPAAAGRARWWLAAFALFVAALLAKTVTCTLPAALLLVLWWKRGRLAARELRALLPFLATGLLLGLLTAHLERTTVRAIGEPWDLSALQRTLIAARAVWFYAGKLAWPAGLSFIYPRWDVSPGDVIGWLALAAALALLPALWRARERIGRGPLVAMLYFGGTLLPALGFVNVYPMRYSFVADHFQYLACVGPLALAAAGLAKLAPRVGPRAAAVGAALLLAALVALCWRREAAYRDAETLWRDTVARNPGSWMAWNNLGLRVAERGQMEEAIVDFEESLRLHPRHPEAENNLAYVFLQLGRLEDAVAHYERAVELDPDYVDALDRLGVALVQAGRADEALSRYEQALRLAPDDPDVHENFGRALAQVGRLPEAIEHGERAVALRPDEASAHDGLGTSLALAGRREEAVAQWKRALELSPADAEAHASLGNVLVNEGRYPEAIPHYEQSLASRPDSGMTQFFLGVALGQLHRMDEALPHYQRAVELEPQFPEAHYNLALALFAAGRMQEAVAEDRRALELRPDWIEARVNLGRLLLAAGEVEPAIAALQDALQRKAELPEAHVLLGSALAQAHRPVEAMAAYRAGLALRPGDAFAQLQLGQLLVATGDAAAARQCFDEAVRLDGNFAPALAAAARLRATAADPALRDGAEAVRLAERACQLSGRRDPAQLDTLAAAYAEAGRFTDAVSAAQEALVLAQSAGPPELVSSLRAHLELFRSGQAFHESQAASRPH